ncbi:S1 family peptidase [Waterburya agarophytonicola]|uniref:S1 family peptidase n=1 Tax=Waterburya agarophytonicola TaxID=2886916 RepID=UPI001E509C01|nr:serine protease [Waterburya agarophytonicola]
MIPALKYCFRGLKGGIFFLIGTTIFGGAIDWYWDRATIAQEVPTWNISPEAIDRSETLRLYQTKTVRVVKADSAGSGVIISREGNIYSVLTNWHVVDSSNPVILTADDLEHQLINPPQHLRDADLAVLQFYSEVDYPTATIAAQLPQVGDTVYAAGFPLAIANNENTLNLGNKAFRLTQGEVSIIPAKSLPQGYRLGYTNDTKVGMSGSPVFNAQGLLVAIHGRGKYRDPGFGVYLFEDGSEPTSEQLEQMIESSWGIPISVYSELIN